MTPQRFYEDFVVGETWTSPSRTLTDAHFFAFAGISGDNHPIHYDDDYAAKGHFGKRVTHGLLLAGMTALGGSPVSAELDDSMLAFVEQRTTFRKPALIGDTVTPTFEVTAVEPKSGDKAIVRLKVTIVGAGGEVLLDGEQVYLIKGRAWKAPA